MRVSKDRGTGELLKGLTGTPEGSMSLPELLQARHSATGRMNRSTPRPRPTHCASWSIYKRLKFQRETQIHISRPFSAQDLNVRIMGQIRSICFRFISTLFSRRASYCLPRRIILSPRSHRCPLEASEFKQKEEGIWKTWVWLKKTGFKPQKIQLDFATLHPPG